MEKLIQVLVFISLIGMSKVTDAHPVAFAGATSFMSNNMAGLSENTLIYSPTYDWGFGLKHISQGPERERWTNFHIGYLVKRWNEFDSQGNFYLFGGPGVLEKENGKYDYFTRAGFQADWESRHIYTMVKYSTGYSSKEGVLEQYNGRIGFAPFVAGYNELNIWGILQVQHIPQREEETMITPLIRMFYKNVLWEAGSSFSGDWLLNFMIRY
ncbi:MAG: hypothetical protein NXH75_06750 [Halobacteriovoraceae bacterium]|nr:hypothetical protein [Halobacteriovoraceae bacterium]